MNGMRRNTVLVGVAALALGAAVGIGAGLVTGATLAPNIHPTYIVHTDKPSVGNPNSEAPDWTYAPCDWWLNNPNPTIPAYTYPGVCVDSEGYIHTPTIDQNGNETLPDTGVPATDYPKPSPLSPADVTPAPDVTPTPQTCTEDMPCWDCTKMGNHICGPGAAPDSITPGTIWPCIAWADGTYSIPANVRSDVCVTETGNYSYPFS